MKLRINEGLGRSKNGNFVDVQYCIYADILSGGSYKIQKYADVVMDGH